MEQETHSLEGEVAYEEERGAALAFYWCHFVVLLRPQSKLRCPDRSPDRRGIPRQSSCVAQDLKSRGSQLIKVMINELEVLVLSSLLSYLPLLSSPQGEW